MERRTLESVIYEREPPIARIILNRADRANTKDAQLVQEIDACLHEMGYGSMSKGVSHHLFRIEACSDDRADEAFAYIDGAPVTAAERRKQPRCAWRKRFDVARQEVSEIG